MYVNAIDAEANDYEGWPMGSRGKLLWLPRPFTERRSKWRRAAEGRPDVLDLTPLLLLLECSNPDCQMVRSARVTRVRLVKTIVVSLAWLLLLSAGTVFGAELESFRYRGVLCRGCGAIETDRRRKDQCWRYSDRAPLFWTTFQWLFADPQDYFAR